MEKINLPLFYQLGAQLNKLTEFTVDPKNRGKILLASFRAYTNVLRLFDEFSTLAVCRATGEELMEAIDDIDKWWKEVSTEKFSEPDPSIEIKFQQVINKAKEFETVLAAELETLATYHVTKKGIYSISDLIARTENMLPDSTRGKIGLNVVEEIRQSGRCLAFDNSTASGFHIIRAIEAIMYDYYIFVCKPASKEKLNGWGDYISALYKLTEDTKAKKSIREDAKKVIALLQLIKDQDRNLIMHPEVFLTPDDAHKLFEIAKGAIIAMTDTLPGGNKK